MAVNNHDQQGKDYRSQPRWSAGKKTEVVLRLLRGESLEELSWELQVEAHRLAAWRDGFLAAGSQGLKVSGPTAARMIGRRGRPNARSAS